MSTCKKTEDFINSICKEVRGNIVRKAIKADLYDHIEQKIESLMQNDGYDFEKAQEETIERMGNPMEIAQNINSVNRFSWHNLLKWVLLAATVLLSIMTCKSAFYPYTTVYYMGAVAASGGVHPPSFSLLMLTMVFIIATIIMFRYSNARTRMIYTG